MSPSNERLNILIHHDCKPVDAIIMKQENNTTAAKDIFHAVFPVRSQVSGIPSRPASLLRSPSSRPERWTCMPAGNPCSMR